MEDQQNRGDGGTRKVDRITQLPDDTISRILSFLPTKEAVRTSILSKRWKSQWRKTPVLVFDFPPQISGDRDPGYADFLPPCVITEPAEVVSNVLSRHDFPMVEKFEIFAYVCDFNQDRFDQNISFAISRCVKELILNFRGPRGAPYLKLPQSVFRHALLEKLRTSFCSLLPNVEEEVTWKNLKEFSATYCELQLLGNILSGSPALGSLKLESCNFDLVIDSKSLRKLMLKNCCPSFIAISCPNLEELYLVQFGFFSFEDEYGNKPVICDTVFGDNTVQLRADGKFKLSITSASLKKLVVDSLSWIPRFEDLFV